jgi:drug/metabolite transporter (DMT)-like permease
MINFSRLRDWGLLLVCNLIWGCQFIFLKIVQEQMGPLFATCFPLALSILVMIPIVHFMGRPAGTRKLGQKSGGDFVPFLLLGVLGQSVVLLFGTWGVRLTLASNAALITLSIPVTTAVMAYFFLGERMTKVRVVSFAFAIAGVLECSGINWRELNLTSSRFLLANIMCFLSVLGSAFYNTYSKRLLDRYSALRVVLFSYCWAFVLILPITVYREPESFLKVPHFHRAVWLGLFFLAFFRSFLALVIYLNVLSRLEATIAGLSNYLIPFIGVLTAGIFLHEHLTKFMILGGALVLASTLLMTLYGEGQRSNGRLKKDGAI